METRLEHHEWWRLRKGDREICAKVRVIANPFPVPWQDRFMGYELRIERGDGGFIRSDLCQDENALGGAESAATGGVGG